MFPTFQQIFNNCNESSISPDKLKCADVTRIYKQKESTINYRPMNVLLTVSKSFERLLVKQVEIYIKPYLSKQFCGFRKGYYTHRWILAKLERTMFLFSISSFDEINDKALQNRKKFIH